MKRTFTAIICTLLLVAVLAGCGSTNPFDAAAKTFSNEGMTITLTSDFSKQSMDGYTVCYAAKTAAVFALHETNDQFAAAIAQPPFHMGIRPKNRTGRQQTRCRPVCAGSAVLMRRS